jgi:hypothetical protein
VCLVKQITISCLSNSAASTGSAHHPASNKQYQQDRRRRADASGENLTLGAALGPRTIPFLPFSASAQTVSDRVVSGPSSYPGQRQGRAEICCLGNLDLTSIRSMADKPNGNIESAGKAMNGLTLAAQVAGDA